MADSKEAQFQQDIITAMVAQGWLTGPASGYDRRTALYTEDFLGYFKDAWPGAGTSSPKPTRTTRTPCWYRSWCASWSRTAPWMCCAMASSCRGED